MSAAPQPMNFLKGSFVIAVNVLEKSHTVIKTYSEFFFLLMFIFIFIKSLEHGVNTMDKNWYGDLFILCYLYYLYAYTIAF